MMEDQIFHTKLEKTIKLIDITFQRKLYSGPGFGPASTTTIMRIDLALISEIVKWLWSSK